MIHLHPQHLGSLSVPELAMWGTMHYLALGGWQQYGVMPPKDLAGCPCPDLITVPYVAALLDIEDAHAEALWLGLIQKGAVSVERTVPVPVGSPDRHRLATA